MALALGRPLICLYAFKALHRDLTELVYFRLAPRQDSDSEARGDLAPAEQQSLRLSLYCLALMGCRAGTKPRLMGQTGLV